MAQFKIYGRHEHLKQVHRALSDIIHQVAMRTLQLPLEKRFHRFIGLDEWQLVAPPDRSDRYLILEVVMFSGRSPSTKKALVAGLMTDIPMRLGLSSVDLEVMLIETPRENWGIRGKHGDELPLGYKIEI